KIEPGSELGVARSGPCPVAQDSGSFWATVAQGSTVMVTWILGCVWLNSLTSAWYEASSGPVKPVSMVSWTTPPLEVVLTPLLPQPARAAATVVRVTTAAAVRPRRLIETMKIKLLIQWGRAWCGWTSQGDDRVRAGDGRGARSGRGWRGAAAPRGSVARRRRGHVRAAGFADDEFGRQFGVRALPGQAFDEVEQPVRGVQPELL